MMAGRLAVLLLVPVVPLAAQQVHYEGSVTAATGRYIFSERTTSAVWGNGLSLGLGRLTLRGSIPVAWQNTILLTASGAGLIPSGGGGERSRAVSDSGQARQRRGSGGPRGQGMGGPGQGPAPGVSADQAAVPVDVVTDLRTALGDPLVSASVRLAEGGRLAVSVGVGAKIPVADTAHFGTGEWDVGAHASFSFRPIDRTLIGLDLAYWHLGDLAELDFQDPVSAGVSLSRLLGSNWGMMLMGAVSTTSIDGFPGPASIGTGITRFAGRSAWGVNLSVGLSDTSPDVSGGITWRIGF